MTTDASTASPPERWRATFDEQYDDRVTIDTANGALYISAGPGNHRYSNTIAALSPKKARELAVLLCQAAEIAEAAS